MRVVVAKKPIPVGPYPGTHWTVLDGRLFSHHRNRYLWCECRCGLRYYVQRGHLVGGRSLRCRACVNRAQVKAPTAPNLPSDTTDFDTMEELDAFIAERRKNLPGWWGKEVPEETPVGWTLPVIWTGRRHNGREL